MIKEIVETSFDATLDDSQSTNLERLPVERFDLNGYEDYEAQLLPRAKAFWQKDSGVAVYRRFRSWPVFSTSSCDMQATLEYQLDGLQKSMAYKMDIPNFIEPWYGIGTIGAAWGDADFIWKEDQAPVLEKKFTSVEEALQCKPMAVKDCKVGKHTLNMIDFFLEKTRGKIPMSVTDTQSPLNNATSMMDISSFFVAMMDNPEGVLTILDQIADHHIEFEKIMRDRVGDRLVKPGHGFCSSRAFKGIGMSDDNFVMVDDGAYAELAQPAFVKIGRAFGGPILHSCGDWSHKLELAKNIPDLVMMDGAFTLQTDPMRNPPEPFGEALANSGIVLEMRCVGKPDLVVDKIKRAWRPGLKLLVVTYCATPQEQEECYNRIHEVCQ